ncbi:tyrosine phosphatase, partial [Oryctes borbonicus]
TCPTHMLNISELLRFSNNQEGIRAEFEKIPQVTTKTNELPEGCDVKNRYANVIPLPETRVFLTPVEGIPSSDYINANYVTGPQAARHYYIACQAPLQNTIEDYWRMIWEQQSKVVLMITHLYENGVEKCIDYLPPSEVLDCHRLFGDFQITLKKREVKDKYIISSLQLKNMVSNSWREVTHLWYMGWPEKGVPEEANSLIAFLIEARSCMKTGENKVKETNNMNISNGINLNSNPVVVHCSPGTGRTGTVIACDIAIREFELTRKVDIPKIVYKIRRDRASAVQTKEQYSFIYKV